MLTASDDGGETWEAPVPLYAYPGWDCFPMGGLVRFADDRLWLVLGRIRFDAALGGDEPMDGWHTAAIESRDGGRTWSEPGPEIRLFPCWTSCTARATPTASRTGATSSPPSARWGATGAGSPAPPSSTSRRGPPGPASRRWCRSPGRRTGTSRTRTSCAWRTARLLAVIREMVTRQAFSAHSADEGRTWSPVRPTGFPGANIKLHRLRSGAVLCAYRDEHPARAGSAAA